MSDDDMLEPGAYRFLDGGELTYGSMDELGVVSRTHVVFHEDGTRTSESWQGYDPAFHAFAQSIAGMAGNKTWWWCSHTDPSRPEGERFVGLTIVEAGLESEARDAAYALGVSSEVETLAVPIPYEFVPGPRWRDRILTAAEAETAGNPEHPEFAS